MHVRFLIYIEWIIWTIIWPPGSGKALAVRMRPITLICCCADLPSVNSKIASRPHSQSRPVFQLPTKFHRVDLQSDPKPSNHTQKAIHRFVGLLNYTSILIFYSHILFKTDNSSEQCTYWAPFQMFIHRLLRISAASKFMSFIATIQKHVVVVWRKYLSIQPTLLATSLAGSRGGQLFIRVMPTF